MDDLTSRNNINQREPPATCDVRSVYLDENIVDGKLEKEIADTLELEEYEEIE